MSLVVLILIPPPPPLSLSLSPSSLPWTETTTAIINASDKMCAKKTDCSCQILKLKNYKA